MIGKYHSHILQTNLQHREEERQNTISHKTSERQLKLSTQPSCPHQDDCKTRKTQSTACTTKQGPNTEPHCYVPGVARK